MADFEITDPVTDLSFFQQYMLRDSRSLLLHISKLMDSVFLPCEYNTIFQEHSSIELY